MCVFTHPRFFFSFYFLFVASLGTSQSIAKVADIDASREGDKINISYRMPESVSSATYKVKVSVAIDGNAPIALNAVSGDVGNTVPGGKSEYRIVWDVFKDVQQIGKAEFFVAAEKNQEPQKPSITTSDIPSRKENKPEPYVRMRKWHIMGDFMTDFDFVSSFGLSVAYYKEWGGYITVNALNGAELRDNDLRFIRIKGGVIYTFNYPQTTTVGVYLGAGVFRLEDTYFSYSETQFGIESGIMASFGPIALSIGLAVVPEYEEFYATAGLGIRF